MVLRVESPYIVIPVSDPYWQDRCMFLAAQLELALRQCMPHSGWDQARAYPNDLQEADVQLRSANLDCRLDDDTMSCECKDREQPLSKAEQTVSSSPSAGCQLQGSDFDFDLLEHSMQVFANLSDTLDLQVDWSLPGLGLVTTDSHSNCKLSAGERVFEGTSALRQRVCLVGLKRKDLNGQVGVLTTSLSASSRCGVLLPDGQRLAVRPCNIELLTGVGCAADSKSTSPTSSAASKVHEGRFQIGHPVLLTGLSTSSLNDMKGNIATCMTSSGRYGVRLLCGRTVAVRPENLKEEHVCHLHMADSPTDDDLKEQSKTKCESALWGAELLESDEPQPQKMPFLFPPGTAKPYTY